MRRWSFLTTQAQVVIYVTQHPHSTVREIADAVGVTQRAAHSALADLKRAGIIVAERSGRRNSYTISFEHLAQFRREGTAPDLVPDDFVRALMDGLRPLQMTDYFYDADEPHPIN